MALASIERDPVLAAVNRYWNLLRADRAMPARREINPIQLGARVLPYVMLVDVVDAGMRFRFRLCGSTVADAAGLDLTGRYIDELNPNASYAEYVTGLYRRVVEARRPLYSESAYMSPASNARRSTRRAMFPLSEDGLAVHHVMAVQTFMAVVGVDPPSMTYADAFRPGIAELL